MFLIECGGADKQSRALTLVKLYRALVYPPPRGYLP